MTCIKTRIQNLRREGIKSQENETIVRLGLAKPSPTIMCTAQSINAGAKKLKIEQKNEMQRMSVDTFALHKNTRAGMGETCLKAAMQQGKMMSCTKTEQNKMQKRNVIITSHPDLTHT